jgi:CO/xanthine dehydrogenase FAD-binding subunit
LFRAANYIKAESLQQAFDLNQKKTNVILGGMVWLKMQKKNINTVIDLSGLGLDTIEETEDEFRIGAMVSLRQMETHEGLNALTQGAARESVCHIVGVQFRNLATVGGSLFGRYGFSDVLTFFMAAGAKVELFQRGILPIEEFAVLPKDNDILVRVIVPKTAGKMIYLSQRNTRTDFPVLTCCIFAGKEDIRCCIGARPMRAMCVRDPEGILADGINKESAKAFAAYVKAHTKTGSNSRGSAEYRSILTEVLTRRALEGIARMESEE